MRKQRLTQQSRIANIERLLIAISMQVEKNTNTLKELTNENHETKTNLYTITNSRGLVKVFTETEFKQLTWWKMVKESYNIKTIK